MAFCLSWLSPTQASAESFYVEMPSHSMSITYPDSWYRQQHQKPDEVFKIIAAAKGYNPMCRIRVRSDNRFSMYPPHQFASHIQRSNYGAPFWQKYLAQYKNAQILRFQDHAGLGQGPASYIEASFYDIIGQGSQKRHVYKRAIMSVTHINNKAYIFECNADHKYYDRWHLRFLNILSQIEINNQAAKSVHGKYRDFTQDRTIRINRTREIDAYYY